VAVQSQDGVEISWFSRHDRVESVVVVVPGRGAAGATA